VGEVDGQPAVIALRQDNGSWIPHSIVRIDVVDHLITRVVDYAAWLRVPIEHLHGRSLYRKDDRLLN
jgi:hypothetical protein